MGDTQHGTAGSAHDTANLPAHIPPKARCEWCGRKAVDLYGEDGAVTAMCEAHPTGKCGVHSFVGG